MEEFDFEAALDWLLTPRPLKGDTPLSRATHDLPTDIHTHISSLSSAAVATITQSSADVTPVSLLGVLLCFLSDSQQKRPEELLSVVCILSVVVPCVPAAVLHLRVEDLAAVFGRILSENVGSESMLRPIVTCVRALLVAQPLHMWTTSPIVLQTLQLLFRVSSSITNATHFRHICASIGSVLSSIRTDLDKRQKDSTPLPLPKGVVSCVKHLMTSWLQKGERESDSEEVHRALVLLKEVIPNLPAHLISKYGAEILSLFMASSSPFHSQQSVALDVLSCWDTLLSRHRSHIYWHKLASSISPSPLPPSPPPSVDVPSSFLSLSLSTLLRIDLEHFFPSVLSSLVRTLAYSAVSLYLVDSNEGRKAAGIVFSALFKVFALPQFKGLRGVLSDSLIDLVVVTVDDRMVEENGIILGASPLKMILETLESGFTFPFRLSFGNILSVYAALFILLQSDATHVLSGVVTRLLEFQESLLKESQSSSSASSTASVLLSAPHSEGVHSVLAASLRGMGLDAFLKIFPLDLPSAASPSESTWKGGDLIGTRSWVLPIIQENVMPGTPLRIFVDNFLPICDALESRVVEFQTELAKVSAMDGGKRDAVTLLIHQHRMLINQIWHLFPSFCYCPSDASTQFRKIAKRLGESLKEENETRLVVCAGLTSLMTHWVDISQEGSHLLPSPWAYSLQSDKKSRAFEKKNPTGDLEWTEFSRVKRSIVTKEECEIGLETIRKYLPNYVPILLNAIGTASPHHSTPLHNLLCAFLKVATKGQREKYFQSVMEKLKDSVRKSDDKSPLDEKSNVASQCVLLNLIVDFVPFVCMEKGCMPDLVMKIRPFMLQSKHNGLQKRAYKVLSSICTNASDFVVSHLSSHLQPVITDKMSSCSSSSKQIRLKCLQSIARTLVRKWKESPSSSFSSSFSSSSPSCVTTLRSFILDTISEVLLCVKEQSAKCRSTASDVLLTFCVSFPLPPPSPSFSFSSSSSSPSPLTRPVLCVSSKKGGVPKAVKDQEVAYDVGTTESVVAIDAFFKLVIGGLAGKSFLMISATLASLTILLRLFRSIVTLEVVKALISVCVTLYSLDSHEVRKGALSLLRTAIGCVTPIDLDPLLVTILGTIFSTDVEVSYVQNEEMADAIMTETDRKKEKDKGVRGEKAKYATANAGVLIRYIVEKLVKKCGFERVEAETPLTHRPLVNHVRKTLQRKDRKQKEKQEKKHDEGQSVDVEMDEKGNRELKMPSGIRVDRQLCESDDDEENTKKRQSGGKGKEAKGTKRDRGEEKDFMISEECDALDLLDAKETSDRLRMEGRFGKVSVPKEKAGAFEFNSEGKLIIPMEEERETPAVIHSGGKRKRVDDEPSAVPTTLPKRQRQNESRPVYGGDVYRSKNADGDVKLKGRVEPYALVAPDGRMLNRRYRKKEAKQFEHLMKKKDKRGKK